MTGLTYLMVDGERWTLEEQWGDPLTLRQCFRYHSAQRGKAIVFSVPDFQSQADVAGARERFVRMIKQELEHEAA